MRRRADSPPGPVGSQESHQAKRQRRSSASRSASPEARRSATSPRIIRQSSPSRPSLPPLHPLTQSGQSGTGPASSSGGPGSTSGAGGTGGASSTGGDRPSPAASTAWHGDGRGPGGQPWRPNWQTHKNRHSLDAPRSVNIKSHSPGSSPERERPLAEKSGASEGRSDQQPASGSGPTNGPDVVFTRDVTNRQPRSMMACVRCRRQKMKCDGPGKEPCRGCRQAGVHCVFESRARPKSISTLPSRASPFFAGSLPPGRGGTPGTAGPSFYPGASQPAPPITSRPALGPGDYAVRGVREPMPPPPNASISSLASVAAGAVPYPPPLRPHSPPMHAQGGPPPGQPPYFAGPPPVSGPYGPPPPGPPSHGGPPPDHLRLDSRLHKLEAAMRPVEALPGAVAAIQTTLSTLVRTQNALAQQLADGGNPAYSGAQPAGGAPRAPVDVPDHVWESYRVGAWPLTPWLPGIQPMAALPALVLECLGRRAIMERTEQNRREGDLAADAVSAEIGRLLSAKVPWTRDEVLSLGVFATWTSDPALSVLSTGLARDLQLDRPHTLRKSHDEWREWIYVVLADHMLHLPDFNVPVVHEPVAAQWRELVSISQPGDPSTHDRDAKLLGWLEFSEILIDIQDMQRATRLAGEAPPSPLGPDSMLPPASEMAIIDRLRGRAREIWRRSAAKLETWASNNGARHDPVLTLYYHYAILYAASPAFTADCNVWLALSSTSEGYQQLERGREAALALLSALRSPEIGRTLTHSFAVLKPLFGLAVLHLVSMATTLGHLPIISVPHIEDVLRSVIDQLVEKGPGAAGPAGPAKAPIAPALQQSLTFEMVENGSVARVGKTQILGHEPCKELWRRLLG